MIESYLQKNKKIKQNTLIRQLRYNSYIINLSIQAFLFYFILSVDKLKSYDQDKVVRKNINIEKQRLAFRLLGPLSKLHNIVVYIRSSTLRTKEQLDLAKRILPLDNRTRQNSQYYLLRVANEKAGAIDIYTKTHFSILEDDFLTPSNQEQLRTIIEFFKLFEQTTKATEGDKVTLDIVLFIIDILIKQFQASSISKLLTSNRIILTSYDRPNISKIKNFILRFKKVGKLLINSIINQIRHLFILLLLFFILNVV